MADLKEKGVRELLDAPNYAVVSTNNTDGSISSTVVWTYAEGDKLTLNSAEGRHWPANLERDPQVTVLVYDRSNPYHYVEVRGRAVGTHEGADEHIDRLAKKYLGADSYPSRKQGEQRIKFSIEPERIRHVNQG